MADTAIFGVMMVGASHPRGARARAASRLAGALLTALTSSAWLGCGHPATRAECEEIFQRSAAIELEALKVTDPEEVRRRTSEARDDRGDELLDRCIGRRITDRAMRCVRAARSAEELDECLL